MLKLTIFAFAVMLTTGVAAQILPAFPHGAEARETQLLARMNPQSRAWIKQEAARKVATGDFSEATAVSAAQSHIRGKNLADGMNYKNNLGSLSEMGEMESLRCKWLWIGCRK